MLRYSLGPLSVILCMLLNLSVVTRPCSADTPIFVDTFLEHPPGSPVNGAKLERGHGRWKGTSGLFFDNGKVKGGGSAEYARFGFVPSNYERSARVYIDIVLDPGATGWAGVGFTNDEDGPLPSVGQLWFKLSHNGKVEVLANGASNTLYHDSHPNPAFIAGENRIKLAYNRRTNSARAWLNGAELPLDAVGKHGYSPDIRAVAFQLRDDGGGLKTKVIGGGGAGAIGVGFIGAVIGDDFAIVPPLFQGNHEGDPLDGVPVRLGDEIWSATAAVGFGAGYATNISVGSSVAMVPFSPDDYPGYAASSVEAIVNPADADWVAVGFSLSASGPLSQDGAVWAKLLSSGVLQISVNGESTTLFNAQVLSPGTFSSGIPMKLTFNRLTGSTTVDLGEADMGIPSTTVNVFGESLPLAIVAVGFEAAKVGGFTATNQFAVDDFAIRTSEEIPPLAVIEQPVSVETVVGGQAEFSCTAAGGVPPYSYRWQRMQPSWVDIDPSTPGYLGVNTSELVISPVSTDLGGLYRCVVVDSNSVPTEAPSNSADLFVLESIASDSFGTGSTSGRVVGSLLDAQTPEFGDGPWSATAGAVLGDGVLTNDVAGINVLAEVPVTQAVTDTYSVLSASANVVIGDADYVAVGFSEVGLSNFFGDGQLFAFIFKTGWVVVRDEDLSSAANSF